MDYIIVRHRVWPHGGQTNEPRFLDATLVTNAESDSDALRAVGEKVPTDCKIGSWEILPVTPDRVVDASV